MRQRSLLIALSIAVLCFSIIMALSQIMLLFLVHSVPDALTHQITARATQGRLAFCINAPPILTIPCSSSLTQNTEFTCQLVMNDSDGGSTVASLQFLSNRTVFSVNASGWINVTPSNDDVGNHTVVFFVNDSSGCENAVVNGTLVFGVANVNDPPYLVQNISDLEFTANTTLSAFFLTDYFADPDADTLTFSSSTPDNIVVTILPSSEVRFTGNVCLPDGELVVFSASDPYNENASSNAVLVSVTCDTPTDSSGDGDSGGGGGGGGGAALVCRSEWICEEWFACLPNDLQWRRCYDSRGCEPERYLKRHCEYIGEAPICKENWLCGEWGVCFANGTQYRSCEDLKFCGSTVVQPPLSQDCSYLATCFDGIQNGDETGIDCGGSCGVCAALEQPSSISSTAKWSFWLLFLILISILVTAGALRYYHAEIARLIATTSFLLKHRAYKDLLLDAQQRKSLLERLRDFESRPVDRDPVIVYEELAALVRAYLGDALSMPPESPPEQILKRCNVLHLRPETNTLIQGVIAKMLLLEREELLFDKLFVSATVEELRTMVLLTSEATQGEMVRTIEELVPTKEMSFYDELFLHTTNALRALQFDQFDIAKAEYYAMLRVYEPLSDQDKGQVYPELRWTFDAIKFANEMTGAKVVEKPPFAQV